MHMQPNLAQRLQTLHCVGTLLQASYPFPHDQSLVVSIHASYDLHFVRCMHCHRAQALAPVPYRRQAVMSSADALASSSGSSIEETLVIDFDNDADPECTVITIEGKDQSDLLMSLTGAFTTSGVVVNSASIQSDEGKVLDVFRVTTMEGDKVGR